MEGVRVEVRGGEVGDLVKGMKCTVVVVTDDVLM